MDIELYKRTYEIVSRDEGVRNFPYVDTVGKITVGIGYNLTDRGMTNEWIQNQAKEDIEYFYNQLNTNFTWFDGLTLKRKAALINMCFMGFKKFCTFKKMIYALENGNYEDASREMKDSLWAKQVKGRSDMLALDILNG